MGIRSDIAIALKAEFVEGFEQVAKDLGWNLGNMCERIDSHEEGKLYYFTDIKWYTSESDVGTLIEYLEECGDENYKTVEACGEYPDSTEGDAGSWNDNPFGARKAVSVCIEFKN